MYQWATTTPKLAKTGPGAEAGLVQPSVILSNAYADTSGKGATACPALLTTLGPFSQFCQYLYLAD